jgi:hypothetical protein
LTLASSSLIRLTRSSWEIRKVSASTSVIRADGPDQRQASTAAEALRPRSASPGEAETLAAVVQNIGAAIGLGGGVCSQNAHFVDCDVVVFRGVMRFEQVMHAPDDDPKIALFA